MSEQVQTAEILFQLSGVGMVETDMRTGRFRRANAAFCELVGYSEAELRGMSYLELTHPDDREHDAQSFAALQRGESRSGTSLTRLLHKDGQTVWAELHVTVLGEGSEQVNLTVVNDVTERRRAEAALEVEKAYAESIVETVHEPLLVLTPDLRVRSANRAFYDHFEVRREETEGQLIYELGNGQWDIPKLRALLEDVLPDSNVFNDYEVSHDFEDIGHRAMLLNARRLDHVQLILLGIRDITERKRAEQVLRVSEERQRFLLELSDALRAQPDEPSIKEQTVKMLAEYLHLDRCWISEVSEQQGISTVGPEHLRPGFPPMSGVFRLSDYAETMRQLATQPLVIPDAADDPRFSDSEKELLAGLQLRALLVVPLRKGQRHVIWALAAAVATPRGWTDGERALLEDVAERTWAAVERARVEAARAASEEKYRTLFETMGQGYCDLELVRDAGGRAVDQRYLELNPAYERLIGIPLAQAKGRTASEVMPELEPWWTETFARIAARGEPERLEYEVASLGRWFEVFAYPRGGDRLTVLYEDVTERRRAEEVLREREARQAFLLKLSDLLQRLEGANDLKAAAMRVLGEHLGVSRAQYHEVDSSGEYYDADGVGYANGLPLLDLKYRIGDFGAFVGEDFAAGRPFRSDDLTLDPRPTAEEREAYALYGIRAGAGVPLIRGGKLVAILAVHNVHPHPWTDPEMELIRETAERVWAAVERARAEAALRDSEERYRTLFESMDEAYAVVEVLADEAGRYNDFVFLEVNPAFTKQTAMPHPVGRKATEILGTPNPLWAEVYGQVAETGEAVRFEAEEPTLGRVFDLYVFRLGGEGSRRVAVLFADITERKRAEAALRASEERLRLTVEGVRDYAIFTLDPERRITSWNPGAERIFGYAEDEALSKPGDILFTPEDRKAGAPEQEARQARERGRAADERWHLRKDGSRFYVSGVTAPLYEGDRLTGYAKIARDLTEQREAEEQLRKWEERYRIALEAAALATWDWDVGADRVVWNEQHYHLFGLEPTPGAETAESFLRFVHPEDLQDVRGALERALVEGDYRAEFRIIRADDAVERWMSGYGRVVERQGDQATRMTGVMFDTTERKRAEAALSELNEALEQRVLERTQALEVSEQRFSQAFYVNPIPACMTTLGRETFVEVNDAFLELTGYERGEVQGRTSRELAMWSSPEDHRRTEAAQKGGAGFRNLELQLRTKDGAVKTILMSAEVIRLDGHEGYLKMFYDISERKQTEEQLHRAIQEVMSNASWFSRSLIDQLRRIRLGDTQGEGEAVELSRREQQVLERLAAGMNNDAIAADLGLSAQTVRNYVSNIYDKLGVRSRAEAVVWARERGFVS
jgi:PAS domain S-box-containing protein